MACCLRNIGGSLAVPPPLPVPRQGKEILPADDDAAVRGGRCEVKVSGDVGLIAAVSASGLLHRMQVGQNLLELLAAQDPRPVRHPFGDAAMRDRGHEDLVEIRAVAVLQQT